LKKIKFGIIGCGRIAQRHAEHINNLGELIAVADVKKDRANELSTKYKCASYNSMDDLLTNEKEIDVISICTPNGLHAEQTIKALNKGFNVLCEKPMALSVIDCNLMNEAAKRNNRKLFIVKQNRFNPPITALKRVIGEGRLGKILNVQLNCFWNRTEPYYKNSDWKGTKNLDGGTLFTQFSHFIDLLYWLVGEIKEVKSFLENFLLKDIIEFEDSGVIILKFKNGAIGTINYTVNSYKKNMEGSITVFGEKGTVKVGGQYLNVLEYQSIAGYEITDVPESRPSNDYGFYQGSMSNHDKIYENVIDVLTNNSEIAINGEEGLKTVEIIEKIYNNKI